jgi:hypothetical protein
MNGIYKDEPESGLALTLCSLRKARARLFFEEKLTNVSGWVQI